VRVSIDQVAWKVDPDTLSQWGTGGQLELNDIGLVRLVTHTPIAFDPYKRNRLTGSLILIDSLTNDTVGAGMIVQPRNQALLEAGVTLSADTQVSETERRAKLSQTGCTVWLTGRPASGTSSLAFALERRLFDLGYLPAVLDPGDTRYPSSLTLDTPLHAAQAARHLVDAGLIAIGAVHTPWVHDREAVRSMLASHNLVLVHVSTPVQVCAARDPQNRYEDGIPPYEVPTDADWTLDLSGDALAGAVETLVEHLKQAGWVG
jgi:bifunctional enzyme CysN/CysC